MPGRVRIATFPLFDPFVDVANLDKFGVELDSFASIGNSISICLGLDMCLIPVVRKIFECQNINYSCNYAPELGW